MLHRYHVPYLGAPMDGTGQGEGAPFSPVLPSHKQPPSLLELSERALLRQLTGQHLDIGRTPPRTAFGDTALHAAASKGHLVAVIILLQSGSQPNVVDRRLRTPLHCAAYHGHLKIAQRLLNAGADVNSTDDCDDTALTLAAGTGNTDIVHLLLERGGKIDYGTFQAALRQENKRLFELFLEKVTADTLDEIGHLLLSQAAKDKRCDIVQLLLEKGGPAVHVKEGSWRALRYALKSDQSEMVRQLLSHGVSANESDVEMALSKAKTADVVKAFVECLPNVVRNSSGVRALVTACERGSLEPLVALLDAGVDINATHESRQSALHVASENGHILCVRKLLQRGADTNAQDWMGSTPLHRASINGHVDCLKALLAGGAHVNAKKHDGGTSLHSVTSYSGSRSAIFEANARAALMNLRSATRNDPSFWHVECVRVLLAAGARVSEGNNAGDTPLHCASRYGLVECVRALLAAGASVAVVNNSGDTPLHSASVMGDVECVRELLRRGANPNAKNRHGDTPLHTALYFGNEECKHALLAAGASPYERNNDGKTPRDVASTASLGSLFAR